MAEKRTLRSILKNTPRVDKALYVSAVVVLSLTTVFFDGSAVTLILTLCGLTGQMLNAHRVKYCYPLYLIQIALYVGVSLKSRFYGEVLLNVCYAAPMYLYAMIFWRKRSGQTQSVIPHIYRLSGRQMIVLAAIGAAVIPLYGVVLSRFDTAMPYLNAASTFISALSIYLVSRRYIEQWVTWNLCTMVQFVLWLTTLSDSPENIPLVVSSVFYLLFNLNGLRTWIRLWRKRDNP